jgi:hypothetical protein
MRQFLSSRLYHRQTVVTNQHVSTHPMVPTESPQQQQKQTHRLHVHQMQKTWIIGAMLFAVLTLLAVPLVPASMLFLAWSIASIATAVAFVALAAWYPKQGF